MSKPPKVGDIVWVSCRGSDKCEHNQAKIVFIKPHPMGTRITRYVCTKCNRPFHISV